MNRWLPESKALLIWIVILVGGTVSTLAPVQAQAPPGWSEPRVLSGSEEIASLPILTTDDSGTVHAFWVSRPRDEESAYSGIVYSRFNDGQWSSPTEVVLSPGSQDALFPRTAVDTIGRLHLFWSAPEAGLFGPLYHAWAPASNASHARQWRPAQLLATGTYQSDVRLDGEGRMHVVFASVTDGAGICHVISADHGETWSEPSCIRHNDALREDEHDVRPRLAIDSNDTLHVVWVLDDYSPASNLAYSGRIVYYARSTTGGTDWSAPLIVDEIDGRSDYNRQTDGLQPEWGNIIVDHTDRVHIVWVGRPDMQRYHQWSSDGGVTWSPRRMAIPSGGYNNWQGLAVDDANRLHLLWPSLKGMEYAWWEEGVWSAPLLLSNVGDTHHGQAVVALGNQLHAVWQDFGGGNLSDDAMGRVFWATLRTNAPARPPEALPVVGHAEEGAPRSVESVAPPQPASSPELASLTEAELSNVSTLDAIVTSTLPALLLVGVVFLLKFRKR